MPFIVIAAMVESPRLIVSILCVAVAARDSFRNASVHVTLCTDSCSGFVEGPDGGATGFFLQVSAQKEKKTNKTNDVVFMCRI